MADKVKANGGVIYLITNLVNGKYYVGQTHSLRARKNQHLSAGQKGKAKFPISRAIAKYGRDNFVFEEIGQATSQASLDNLEFVWISVLSASDKRFGYNRRLGGSGSSCSAETRRLQSESARKRTPVWGPHNPMPQEIRNHLAECARSRMIGKPSRFKGVTGRYSEETLKKISESSKGRIPHNKGKSPSTETLQKFRNRPRLSDESRMRISELAKGRRSVWGAAQSYA